MPNIKPRIFFDTQLVIERAKSRICDEEWTHARNIILENFQYCVSPLTFLELLNGIATGSETRFQKFRSELNALIPKHKQMNFLISPGGFVLETLFDINRPHDNYEPRDLQKWVKVIFRAKSYQEMIDGEVSVANVTRKTMGLNLTVVLEQTRAGKRILAEQLTKVRAGELKVPNKPTWARSMLIRLGHQPSQEQCMNVGEALDAAYQFFLWVCQQAKTSNYNFEKHGSDWFDSEQLYYLADQHMYFLTSDGDFSQRVGKSRQAGRIITHNTGGASSLAQTLKRALESRRMVASGQG